MKSTVETLSPTRVRLAVEVPFDELKPSFDKAYKTIGAQVRVPGFRPGKVPGRVLEQRLGRPAILEEVVQDAVPRAYDEAVRSNEVRALGRPEIEVTSIDDGQAVSFTAEVDVRPELDLPAMDSVSVVVEDVVVDDAAVDEQIAALRERFATLSNADRPAQDGDMVSLDLAATVDGEPVADGTAEGLSHEVGSGMLIDGLDAAIVGLSAGETATFQADLTAGDAAGTTADISVTVQQVKAKELPALDDEFAQLASEFDTLEELRADAVARLTRVKALEQGNQARDRVIEHLVETVEVPLPEAVVVAEVEWREHSLRHQLEENELTMEGMLEQEGQTEEEFKAQLRTTAETAVRTQLILDTYADSEQVGVSEQDLTQHIVVQARRYRVTPEQFAQQVTENKQLSSMVADVRRSKVVAMLLDAATVTDASGRTVDIAALFGATPGETVAAPSAEADAETDAEGETGTDVDSSVDATDETASDATAPDATEGTDTGR